VELEWRKLEARKKKYEHLLRALMEAQRGKNKPMKAEDAILQQLAASQM